MQSNRQNSDYNKTDLGHKYAEVCFIMGLSLIHI